MARFTLVIRPDGRALLTTAESFRTEQLEPVRAVLDEWLQGRQQVLLVTECELVQVTELEVDLEARRIHRAPAEAL